MHQVIAIVGMAGSGKSEVSRLFEEAGFHRVRFGDVTDEEVKRRGLALNEENERRVRELLRKEHGMAAYAVLNLSRIDRALETAGVIIDGLYSWEEYRFLGERYPAFKVLAVYASPATRYRRLASRAVRPLAADEARQRDITEIENLKKGGPIAMADFTIINESSLGDLQTQTRQLIARLKDGTTNEHE
ncbi:MAG: AAA family ATPase [Chloroflexi bacterium]|nr:AAA family ATPase [Chloroflexota bacterium]